MIHWLHHLFSPHCPECAIEKLEARACHNCETLRQLLETEKFENKQLLDRILAVPVIEKEIERELPQAIQPKSITSLKVRREMLEQQDRVKADILRRKELEVKTNEQLEKELLNPEIQAVLRNENAG